MTTPSTVYRTLDVLERLGLVRHAHGLDGEEEYHLLPREEHGHLFCWSCGNRWELAAEEAEGFVVALREARGFEVDLSHVTVVGTCGDCALNEHHPVAGDAVSVRSDQSPVGTPRMLKPPST